MTMKGNLLILIEMLFIINSYITMLKSAKISSKSYRLFVRANNLMHNIIIEFRRLGGRRLWGRVLMICWLSRGSLGYRIARLCCPCMLIKVLKIVCRTHNGLIIEKIWVRIICQSLTLSLLKPAECQNKNLYFYKWKLKNPSLSFSSISIKVQLWLKDQQKTLNRKKKIKKTHKNSIIHNTWDQFIKTLPLKYPKWSNKK